jgi:hypothetical protein
MSHAPGGQSGPQQIWGAEGMSDGAGESMKRDEREVSARERAALGAWAVKSPARAVARRNVRGKNGFDGMLAVLADVGTWSWRFGEMVLDKLSEYIIYTPELLDPSSIDLGIFSSSQCRPGRVKSANPVSRPQSKKYVRWYKPATGLLSEGILKTTSNAAKTSHMSIQCSYFLHGFASGVQVQILPDPCASSMGSVQLHTGFVAGLTRDNRRAEVKTKTGTRQLV